MSADPRDERIRLSAAESRAQRRRSVAIGVTLVAMVVVFYVVTLIKMGAV
jgi:hypothetical protein